MEIMVGKQQNNELSGCREGEDRNHGSYRQCIG